jgi:hypothetical protein
VRIGFAKVRIFIVRINPDFLNCWHIYIVPASNFILTDLALVLPERGDIAIVMPKTGKNEALFK